MHKPALRSRLKHGLMVESGVIVDSKESTNMRSYAVIKASPNEGKFMHVELSANDSILCISMLQKQNGVVQAFTLVKVAMKKLLVGFEPSRNDFFVVCMDVGAKIEGDIWCYTTSLMRNKWLVTLQNNGAQLAYISKCVKGKLNIDNFLYMTVKGGEANYQSRNSDAQGKHISVQREEDKAHSQSKNASAQGELLMLMMIIYTCVFMIWLGWFFFL